MGHRVKRTWKGWHKVESSLLGGISLPPLWYSTYRQSHCTTPAPLFLHLPQFLFLPPLCFDCCLCPFLFASCKIFISCLHLAAHCRYYICTLSRILRSTGITINTHIVLLRLTLTPPPCYILSLNPNPNPKSSPNPTNPLKELRKGNMSSLCICVLFFLSSGGPQSNWNITHTLRHCTNRL